MKSKAYILMQIGQLLEKNRGYCEEEVTTWVKENETKTVYHLSCNIIKSDYNYTSL